MYYKAKVDCAKATFIVSEEIQNNVRKPRGIACAVSFKGAVYLLTSSSAVEARDSQKKLIAERFSRKHFGDYLLDVSFFLQNGNFTLLKIAKEYEFREIGKSWVISLNLESPSSEMKELAKLFCGKREFKLKLKCVGNSTTIEVINKKRVDRTSIIGTPIIIEKRRMEKKHSGRFSVIGVVGLTSAEKLCPYYWDLLDENARGLGEFCLVCAYIHLAGLPEISSQLSMQVQQRR